MLANMACSLIEHKRIKTTLAKGKALRMYIEPLITKSKNDTTHSRRVVFSYLKQKEAVTELFGDISSKVSDISNVQELHQGTHRNNYGRIGFLHVDNLKCSVLLFLVG